MEEGFVYPHSESADLASLIKSPGVLSDGFTEKNAKSEVGRWNFSPQEWCHVQFHLFLGGASLDIKIQYASYEYVLEHLDNIYILMLWKEWLV